MVLRQRKLLSNEIFDLKQPPGSTSTIPFPFPVPSEVAEGGRAMAEKALYDAISKNFKEDADRPFSTDRGAFMHGVQRKRIRA